MRSRILLKALAFIFVSIGIPAHAQQNNMDSLLLRLREFSNIPGVSVERIEKTHKYVDLGLSVKWATCNVGADRPEDYGNYYCWGNTEPRTDDAEWLLISDQKVFNDTDSILDLKYDAAHVNWGGSWRMPTYAEQAELSNTDNCSWTWYGKGNTEFGGIAGYKVQSRKAGYTDKFIFLPAAGYRDSDGPEYIGNGGYYWSSSADTGLSDIVNLLTIFPEKHGSWSSSRYRGFSVRPVCP